MTTKMCKKSWNWWFVFCGEFLCREVWQWPCEVRLGRASREAGPQVDTDSTSSKVSCCQGNWNKSNERKIHYDTVLRKLYFWGKRFLCLSTVSFDFLLKRLLNQQFAPLKGAWVVQLYLCVSTVSFSLPFCIFLLKNTIFNVTSCKSVSFAIIVLSLKKVHKMSTEKDMVSDVYLYAIFETSRYWRVV